MKLAALAHIRQGMVLAGRGAGARPGDWELRVVESADIVDDHVAFDGLRTIEVRRDVRSAAHLLEPDDILVTARAHAVKVALVPPDVPQAVAGATLLVVRTPDPWSGFPLYLWYYLASTIGRAQVAARLTATALPTLSVRALGEVPVPISRKGERRMAGLVRAWMESRAAALEAAHVRHEVLRDAIIGQIMAGEED